MINGPQPPAVYLAFPRRNLGKTKANQELKWFSHITRASLGLVHDALDYMACAVALSLISLWHIICRIPLLRQHLGPKTIA